MIYYSDDFVDYDNNKLQVRWTKKLWNNHLKKHFEIKDFKTASALIVEALLRPSLVMCGKNVGKKRKTIWCYYKELKKKPRSSLFY